MAVARLEVKTPTVGSAPCSGPGCSGAVGVPVWLWTDPWTTKSATVAIDGVSITATAQIRTITWDLGDGRQVVCNNSGTPFDVSMGWGESPTCGAAGYQTPADAYTITATATWDVTWTGAETGQDVLTTTATRQIRVGEYQSVITS